MSYDNYFKIFKWVYGHLQPFAKKRFWILIAFLVFVATLETIALGSVAFFASVVTDHGNVLSSKYLYYIKKFIEADFLNSEKGLIIGSGFFMFCTIAIKNCFRALANYCIARFSGTAEAYFGNILLDGFIKMPFQWHLDQNSADLINAIQWRNYLGRNFFYPCLTIFSDTFMILIMLSSLLILQPLVSFAVLIFLGSAAMFIYKVIRSRIDKFAAIAKDYQLAIHKETSMSIQGIKDVKICGCEDMFVSKYLDNAIPLSKILGTQKFFGDSPVLILETVGFGMLFLATGIMLLKFDITTAYITGTMALLAVTAWKMLPAVSQILNNFSGIRKLLPHIQVLIDYVTVIESNQINKKQSISPCLDFSNRIKFENVSFSYQSHGLRIIQNLSFEIKKGRTIGIIGTSGSGKSTLVDLLIGLLHPDQGAIYIDHTVLTKDMVPAWLGLIGYVPQSSYIYDTTLAENIAFGVISEQIDRSLVKKCCTMASMDDFVNNLPDRIDSFIGERGVKLSGGQQQRVAIARALYRKPEIMIFDEATSSLDTKSEKSIKETIYSFKGKQTLIVIAHRLSTVKECDKVIWLENGKISMIGEPHKVLESYQERLAD